MAAALAEAERRGGELVRWEGGYWTYPGCPASGRFSPNPVPDWYVGTETVWALVDRGELEAVECSERTRDPVRVRLAQAGALVVDFEASRVPGGVPIEVAWSVPGSGEVASSLVLPRRGWDLDGKWEAAAEAVHGISRAQLLAEGRPADEVAAEFLQACEGRRVLSDMPMIDGPLARLLCGPGAPPPIGEFWPAVQAAAPEAAVVRAIERMGELHPAQHRAAADVRRLCCVWELAVLAGARIPRAL
jgi:hypothetical protein